MQQRPGRPQEVQRPCWGEQITLPRSPILYRAMRAALGSLPSDQLPKSLYQGRFVPHDQYDQYAHRASQPAGPPNHRKP
jgi:hypothetical protein